MTARLTPQIPSDLAKLRPVFVLDGRLAALFARVGAPYAPAFVEWDEVDNALARAPATALAVVDPYAGARRGDGFPRMRDLLRRFPSVPVLAAMELGPGAAADVAMLLEWGVSEVVALGTESAPGALAARLRQAHARPFKRALEAALSPWVGAETRSLLRAAAEVAAEAGEAAQLAARVGVRPATLGGRCARAHLPPPRRVQSWMRLLLACLLLDDPGRTVYAAAYAGGYDSERSLRRSITTLLGMDSTALRRAGAFRTAAAAFDAALRETREAARDRGRP